MAVQWVIASAVWLYGFVATSDINAITKTSLNPLQITTTPIFYDVFLSLRILDEI